MKYELQNAPKIPPRGTQNVSRPSASGRFRSIHVDFVLLHDYPEVDDAQIDERVAEVKGREAVVDHNEHYFEEGLVSFSVG